MPLYEVKGNKIGISLNLQYNASGLRPEVHPGWVGNGWSLAAGGVITRIAKGDIDEYKKSFAPTQGYYFSHNNLNNTSWSSTAVTNQAIVFPAPSSPFGATKDADTEPDEFDFSFMGFSGKFFLDQAGQWQVQGDKSLKVIFDPADFITPFISSTYGGGNIDISNVSPTFGRFTIVDPDGNRYIFGSTHPSDDAKNTAIEFSDVMVPASGERGRSLTATSWFLSQIISADGSETINLNYERGPFTSSIVYGMSKSYSNTTIPGSGWLESNSCTEPQANQQGFSGSIISPVYLTAITMPKQGVEIDFTTSASNELSYPLTTTPLLNGANNGAYSEVLNEAGINTNPAPSDYPSFYLQSYTSPELIPYFGRSGLPDPGAYLYCSRIIWLKLDAITIKNSETNELKRTINLVYNNNPQKRLHLNAVSFLNSGGQEVQKYGFSYNPTPLPAYLSTITDHWGYNNNQKALAVSPDFASLRAPDPTGVQTQAEMLTSISYPTGGTTRYIYEPNSYSSVVNRSNGTLPVAETGIAGGLRIKQIISDDNNGNTLTRKYFYVKNYQPSSDPATLPSSGVLDSKPIYSFVVNGTDLTGTAYTFTAFSSSPVIPMTVNSSGTHIGYTNVVEQLSDGSYSAFTYTNHDNGYNDLAPVATFNKTSSIYTPITSLAYERGKLLKKTDYNSSGLPVAENTFAYTNSVYYYSPIAPTFSANSVFSSVIPICMVNNRGAVSRTAYLLKYTPFVPSTESNTIYDISGSGVFKTVTTNYVYDQYKNVKEQSFTNSDGVLQKKYFQYPYNFTDNNPNNTYNTMMDLNMHKLIMQTNSTVTGGNEFINGGEIHTYQQYGTSQFLNDALYNFENTSPVPAGNVRPTIYKGMESRGQLNFDSRFKLRESFYYDDNGNISSVTDNSGHSNAYIWDYNKNRLAAQVKNANNIYNGLAPANNVTKTNTIVTFVPGTLNTTVIDTITVQGTGPLTLSLAYWNPTISGNNSSTVSYQVRALDGSFYSGNLCASTPGGTSACGATAATATIPSLYPGRCIVTLKLTNMTGFQNYYGYNLTLSYPFYQYNYTPSNKNEIAYTSFEYNNASNISSGSGNWTGIDISKVVTGKSVTGTRYYNLAGSTLTTTGLNFFQKYVVSYWSKNGAYPVSGSTSMVQGVTLPSGWTNYKHYTGNASSVAISGTGSIDELRVYPIGAQMTSYSYEFAGMNSAADANPQMMNYNYDNYQRLSYVSDQKDNIVKGYGYNYRGIQLPMVNTAYISGTNTITAEFIPVANCVSSTVACQDVSTGTTISNTGGCGGQLTVSPIITAGHSYKVTVSCSTASATITSAPVIVTAP